MTSWMPSKEADVRRVDAIQRLTRDALMPPRRWDGWLAFFVCRVALAPAVQEERAVLVEERLRVGHNDRDWDVVRQHVESHTLWAFKRQHATVVAATAVVVWRAGPGRGVRDCLLFKAWFNHLTI